MSLNPDTLRKVCDAADGLLKRFDRLVTGELPHEKIILKSRVIPAAMWKGKMFLGVRGRAHSRIVIEGAQPYDTIVYGFFDPVTGKFLKRSDAWFDVTELS